MHLFWKRTIPFPQKSRASKIADGFYHCVYFHSIQQNVANLMRTSIFRAISTEYMICYDCNGLTIAFFTPFIWKWRKKETEIIKSNLGGKIVDLSTFWCSVWTMKCSEFWCCIQIRCALPPKAHWISNGWFIGVGLVRLNLWRESQTKSAHGMPTSKLHFCCKASEMWKKTTNMHTTVDGVGVLDGKDLEMENSYGNS